MSGRRRHGSLRAVAWFVPAFAVLLVLAAAEDIMRHSLAVAVALVLLPLAGFLVGRLSVAGFKRLAARRVGSLAELTRLRAQVDALEAAAGRPLEAIAASYRTIQRNRYGGSS